MLRGPPGYVVYLRARTSRQRNGGLGMDAQHAAVVEFLRQHGGTIVAQYVEIESGNRSTRPELAMALEAARKGKATLLIAKLDRLARNQMFLANLKDAGVDFVACDQPFASRLTLHILAAEAEDEVRRIRKRTKAALQAAKARGVKLGSPIAVETVGAARAARSRYSANANAATRAVIADIQRSGVLTWSRSARPLKREACARPAATRHGGPFKCGGCWLRQVEDALDIRPLFGLGPSAPVSLLVANHCRACGPRLDAPR
jgi:DNA invertase Pin-like site-specific DNA recombinase